ncbi:hypothetical protein [Nocardia sp. NPDC002869]|uniref:hypothetical protein n=1 Tax=Nocardia sp. NPDC002869 TaxID=3161032 RepID=UPI00398D0101
MDVDSVVQSAVLKHINRSPTTGAWRVYFPPDIPSLPEELSGSHFDAVAIDEFGRGGVVYKVVQRKGSGISEDEMSLIAEMRSVVRGLSGWDFEIIFLRPDRAVLDDESEMLKRLAEAKTIMEIAPSSAFVSAYAVLEWKLARLVKNLGLKYSPNTVGLVSELISAGYLDDEYLASVRAFQRLRNALVHAHKVDQSITAELVNELIQLIEQIDAGVKVEFPTED